jgi:hypothetical protein
LNSFEDSKLKNIDCSEKQLKNKLRNEFDDTKINIWTPYTEVRAQAVVDF